MRFREYPHEIIEFPLIIYNLKKMKIETEFQSHCRPMLNPTLTQFCKSLTGITQKQVDESPLFPGVISRIESFLREKTQGFNPGIFTNDNMPKGSQCRGPRYRRRNWAFVRFLDILSKLIG